MSHRPFIAGFFILDKQKNYDYIKGMQESRHDRYIRNRDAVLKYQKEYYQANKAACKAGSKKYYDANSKQVIKRILAKRKEIV